MTNFLDSSPNTQAKPTNVLASAVQNFFPSLGSNIGAIGSAITHPISTIENLAGTAVGEAEKVVRAGGTAIGLPPKIGSTAQENQASQFNQNFLGGLLAGKGFEGFNQKFATDPVGALVDISVMGDGVSSALDVANHFIESPTLAATSQKLSGLSSNINPLNAPGKIIGKTLEKIGTPSAETVANMKTVSEVGLNPKEVAIQAVSGNKVVNTAANFIKTGIFGKGITNEVNDTISQLQGKTNELINTIPKSLDNPTLGQKIIDAKNAFETNQGKITDKLYNDIEQKYGSAPAKIDNTLKAIDDQIKQLQTSAVPDSENLINKLSDMKDNLQYGKANLNIANEASKTKGFDFSTLNKGGVLSEYQPTVDILKATRTSIGRMIGKDNAISSVVKPIYKALSDDRLDTVNAINPQAGAEIIKADALYRGTLDKLGSNVSSVIDNATPEQIVNKFISGNNSTSLNALKSIVDPQTFTHIGLAWFADTISKATDPTTGVVNLDKFNKILNSLDEPTKNVLFDSKQLETFKTISDTAQKINKLDTKLTKDSTPGKFIQNSMAIRGLGLPFMMLLGGGSSLMKYLVPMLGGEAIGAKLFTSDLGKSILATGSEGLVKTGKTVQKVANVAGKVGKVGNIIKETK